jgi:hypothetical protein
MSVLSWTVHVVLLLATTCVIFMVFFTIGKFESKRYKCQLTIEDPQFAKELPFFMPMTKASRCKSSNRSLQLSTGPDGNLYLPVQKRVPNLSPILTNGFAQYKQMRLINIRSPEWSLLSHSERIEDCNIVIHAQTSLRRKFSCFALSRAAIDGTYNLQRHEEIASTDDADQKNSTGFFGNVANPKGRVLMKKKMSKLLAKLTELEEIVLTKLKERNILPGSPVVVMVLNAGEMDIFANFMCSCRKYNIDTTNFLVFTASEDVLPIVERMNVIGVYHRDSFADAAKFASHEYLDPIFIDMMWYKSFSLWLLLHLGYDVLFQDVDLVWFRDPFSEFKRIENVYKSSFEQGSVNPQGPDGFFSDDGQRSLRYAPFYANSGFFYLKSNPRMIHFAWSIMTAFDILHISGSHQNVFTLRLLEGLDFSGLRPVMLSMTDFPSGVKFSHDRPFMRGIRDGHEMPFIFHMCWTKNREHKLVNFHEAGMWYVNDRASTVLGAMDNATFYENYDYHEILDNLVPDKSWRRRNSTASILPFLCGD